MLRVNWEAYGRRLAKLDDEAIIIELGGRSSVLLYLYSILKFGGSLWPCHTMGGGLSFNRE